MPVPMFPVAPVTKIRMFDSLRCRELEWLTPFKPTAGGTTVECPNRLLPKMLFERSKAVTEFGFTAWRRRRKR